MEPVAAGALPLLFLHWDAGSEWAAMVEVHAGDPPVRCLVIPDCGCDACDDGSDSMLPALDEGIVPVTATGEGWSASGSRSGREISALVEGPAQVARATAS